MRAGFPEEARGFRLLCASRKRSYYIPNCFLAPYTGWFTRKCRYFWRWQSRSLWKEISYEHVSQFCMVTEVELLEPAGLTPWRFCFLGWVNSGVYKIKVDSPDELLSRIFEAAARLKNHGDQLRRTTRVAECTEVDGGILSEHLVRTVTDMSYLCKKMPFKY
jgi:hypothetical protein